MTIYNTYQTCERYVEYIRKKKKKINWLKFVQKRRKGGRINSTSKHDRYDCPKVNLRSRKIAWTHCSLSLLKSEIPGSWLLDASWMSIVWTKESEGNWREEGERRGCAGRQLITVSKLQSRLMAKLITNGAAFRARSHASVCWRRIGVTRFRVPFYRHAVLDDNTLALEFPGLKIEKLTVAGWT